MSKTCSSTPPNDSASPTEKPEPPSPAAYEPAQPHTPTNPACAKAARTTLAQTRPRKETTTYAFRHRLPRPALVPAVPRGRGLLFLPLQRPAALAAHVAPDRAPIVRR